MELNTEQQLTEILSRHVRRNLSKCKLYTNEFFHYFDFILDGNIIPNFEDKNFQDAFQVRFIKKISENKYRIFCTKFILLIKWFRSYDDVYNEHMIMFDYQIVKRRD
jgi:hypothetical protein